MDDTSELNPSHLGTKEHWDESYTTETKNYLSHGDVGEVWFDESSQFRVIKWMNNSADVKTTDSIIDLGKFTIFNYVATLLKTFINFRNWKWNDADRTVWRRLHESDWS